MKCSIRLTPLQVQPTPSTWLLTCMTANPSFGMGNPFSISIKGMSSPYNNPADTLPFDL